MKLRFVPSILGVIDLCSEIVDNSREKNKFTIFKGLELCNEIS